MHVMRVAILKRKKKGHLCVAPFPFPQLSPLCCFNNSGWDMGRGGGREDRADCVRDAFVFEKGRRREEMLAAATGAPRCGKNFPEACEL